MLVGFGVENELIEARNVCPSTLPALIRMVNILSFSRMMAGVGKELWR